MDLSDLKHEVNHIGLINIISSTIEPTQWKRERERDSG